MPYVMRAPWLSGVIGIAILIFKQDSSWVKEKGTFLTLISSLLFSLFFTTHSSRKVVEF
jgi:hypothetical protein